MALNHRTVTANTTTATLLARVNSGSGKINVTVGNNDASNAIYIGASNVTASGATQGLKLAAGANINLQVDGGDSIYVISASGTPSTTILWFGN